MRGFEFLSRLGGGGGEEEPAGPKQEIRARYENELGSIASSDFGGRLDVVAQLMEQYGGSEDALRRAAAEGFNKNPEVIERVVNLARLRRELAADVGEDTIPPVDMGAGTISPDTMRDFSLGASAEEGNADMAGDAAISKEVESAVEDSLVDAPLFVQEALRNPEQKESRIAEITAWMKKYMRKGGIWMKDRARKDGLTILAGGSAGFVTRLAVKAAFGPGGIPTAMAVGGLGGAAGGFAREMVRQRGERKRATIAGLEKLLREIGVEAVRWEGIQVRTLEAADRMAAIENVLEQYGVHGEAGMTPEELERKKDEVKSLVSDARERFRAVAQNMRGEDEKGALALSAILDARENTANINSARRAEALRFIKQSERDIERKGLDWKRVSRAVLIGAVAGAAGGALANYIHEHGWFGGGKGPAVAMAEEKARAAGAMTKPGTPNTSAGATTESQMDAFARPVDAPESAPLAEEAPTAHDAATTPEVSHPVAETAAPDSVVEKSPVADPAVVRKGDGFWHVVRRQFAAQKGYSPEDLKDPAKLAEVNRATAKAMARGYTDAEGHHDILNKDGGEARLTEKSIGARITVNESGDIAIAEGAKEMTYPWHSVPDGPAETVGGIEAAPPDTLPVRTFNPDDLRIAPTGRSQIEIIMPEVPLPKRMVDLLNEFGPENARAWAATTNASEFLGDVLSGATGERQVKMAHAIFGLHLPEAQLEHTTMEDLLWKHGAKLKFAFEHDSFFGTKDALSLAKKLGFKEAYEQEAFSRFSVRKFVDSFPPATKDWPAFLRQHEVAFAHERSSVRLPRITKDHLRLARVIRDLGYDRKRLTFGELFADDKRLAQIASMFDKIKK